MLLTVVNAVINSDLFIRAAFHVLTSTKNSWCLDVCCVIVQLLSPPDDVFLGVHLEARSETSRPPALYDS